MKSWVFPYLWPLLLALSVSGCTTLSVLGSVAGLGLAGAHQLTNSKAERTFSSPLPEVQEAARHALLELEIPIVEDVVDQGEAELKGAVPDLIVTVTIASITPRATKVRVRAGYGLSRDKATAEAIMDHLALNLPPPRFSALAPPPPPQVGPFPSSVPFASQREASPSLGGVRARADGRDGRVDLAPSQGAGATLWGPQGSPIPAVAQAGAGSPPPAASDTPAAKADLAEQLYREALEEYVQGDFENAIKAFQRYVRLSPWGEQVAGAYYWLGETYYRQQNYLQAILAFEMVIREYPESKDVPRALLREVAIYQALRQPRLARAASQKLLARFPQSWEAQSAQGLADERPAGPAPFLEKRSPDPPDREG